MNRRQFLRAGSATALLAVAGCTGADGGATPTAADTPAGAGSETPERANEGSLPEGVYVQQFLEGMAMQGTTTQADYGFGLMYAVPHVFWNVTGTQRNRIEKSGNIHLMTVVWDDKTEMVLPGASVSVTLTRNDELVSQEVIYPMLSQRMGFHWGGNFRLASDGEYTARVSVGGLSIRRTGEFEERFSEPVTAEIPVVFNEEQRSKVTTEPIDEYGQNGAVRPMEMGMIPQAIAPDRADLPGTLLGETTSDDAVFRSIYLSGAKANRFGGEEYLAVSARTPYNSLVLPSMGLDATVRRSGTAVFENTLEPTLDPDLYYHYGTVVDQSLQSGDEVELSVRTPPQLARHEGYERAFLQMDESMVVTVP